MEGMSKQRKTRTGSLSRITFRLAGCLILGGTAFAQNPAARAERELLVLVNQARQEQGLAPLHWDQSLAAAARQHAEVMAEHHSAQHAFPGEPNLSARAKQAGAHFSWLSENVVEGASAEAIHEAFMKSALHRANILDKDMDSVGIGVEEREGELYAVEDFDQAK
jgi:uncharacterized protein YkwD